jgi:hypothetical protein
MRIKTFALLVIIAFGFIFFLAGVGQENIYSIVSTHIGSGFIGVAIGILFYSKYLEKSD